MTPLRLHARSKYGAVKVAEDGYVFDSKREHARYLELKLLQKAGEISGLQLQPAFDLFVVGSNHRSYKIGEYIADFSYAAGPKSGATGKATVEDVKGFKTPLYRWKRKHVEAQYGITIRET